jgi:hypothetical protein
MKGLRSVFVILSLIIFISVSSAQITITEGSIIPIGSAYTSYVLVMNPTDVNPGSPGENQTWEIPEYPWDYTSNVEIVNPDDTPYAGDFPTATFAVGAVDGDSWMFYGTSADAYYILGSASSSGASPYDDAGLVMPLPLSFDSPGWTTVVNTTQDMGGDIIRIESSTETSVDGWGTLTTPYGSNPVIRVFGHTSSSSYMNGDLVFSTEFVGYMWYNQQGVKVGEISSDFDVTDPNFTTGTVNCADAAVPVDPIRGPVAENFIVGQNYPNPFNPTTSLPISLDKSCTVEITVYNELGEVVSSMTRTFSPGEHTVGFDGSAWASGTYFANVRTNDQQITKKMQLVK